MDTYLNLGSSGKNSWWRTSLAVGLMLFFWWGLGSIPFTVLYIRAVFGRQIQDAIPSTTIPGVDPLVSFIAVMLASVFFLIGIVLAIRFVHGRSMRSLVTPDRSLDWKRLFQGALLWFGIGGVTSVLEALLYPGRYVWTFDPVRFFPFALIALILVPIQTSTEELFFRAYVLQGVGSHFRNIWVLSAISGILFMAPHFLNPEAGVNFPLMGLFYFSMGAFLAFITLRDGRLELALGVHAANNLFSFIVVNSTTTVLSSPSLFTSQVLDPVFSVPTAIVGMFLFVLLMLRPLRTKLVQEPPLN
jgi:uncharacterized protein